MICLSKSTTALTLIALLVLGLGVAAIIYLRRPMVRLNTENLQAARRQWSANGVQNYDMSFSMAGSTYTVRVRDGRIADLRSADTKISTNRPADYTIDGIFDILEMELDALSSPRNPFGGDESTTFLRVRFHPQLGYVEGYLRAVGGTGRSYGIEVIDFTPYGEVNNVSPTPE